MFRLKPSEGVLEEVTDLVAEEKPLHLFVNKKHFVTILSTPQKRRELALGHIVSEGVIDSLEDVKSIELSMKDRCEITLNPRVRVEERLLLATPFARVISSSCGTVNAWPLSKLIDRLHIQKIQVDQRFDARIVLKATQDLNFLAENFRKTGGLHAAALYEVDGKLLAFAEDIGRHNAVDKVIGTALLKKRFKPSVSFISTTGRLTADIVLKAARMKIPLLASLSAPLESGIQVARRTGLTLIGFVRGPRMNVYTGLERVQWKEQSL
jgi:FdhD protein